MSDKIKMKKVYKCAVKNCTNLVLYPGCFCKRCIDKLIDENYNVYYCNLCYKVTYIYHKNDFIEELNDTNKKYDSRIRLECCEKCINDLFDDIELDSYY